MTTVAERFIKTALTHERRDAPWWQYLHMLCAALDMSTLEWENYTHSIVFDQFPEEAKCASFWEAAVVSILLELEAFGPEAIEDGESILATWREDRMIQCVGKMS